MTNENSGQSRAGNFIAGITLIVAAAFTISVQDVVFKFFSSELTLWQIFTLRGMLAVPMLLGLLWIRGQHKGVVRTALSKWPLLRALFITTTFLAFYSAIPFLSLATVGAANYMAPIFVALLSAYAIREPVSRLGWLGVILGFSGVVVLLQPGTDAFSLWSILPIIGAGFYALAHITTRAKCHDTPLSALSLSQNLIMMSAGAIVSLALFAYMPQGEFSDKFPYLFGVWSAADLKDWLVLGLLAVFSIVISLLLAGAYQSSPPATISTFEYSYLVFVAIWDTVFFGIDLTLTSLTGMVMIVVAGLMVLKR